MAFWTRTIAKGISILALGVLLADCGGGGGGNAVIVRLFFGINGSGACDAVTVDLDLHDANAVLNHQGNGDPDCAIATGLGNAGCHATFTELNGGDSLRATINGCLIPAVSTLFQCGFLDVDASRLNQDTDAQCTCHSVAGCDPNPPICVNADSSPGSCENCSNGVDDDGNGLIDCNDPNCKDAPNCKSSGTTTTVSGTTTTNTNGNETTTTTNNVTTTTIGHGGDACTLTYRLVDDVKVGSLQWDTDYSAAPGQMQGVGANVVCSTLVQGALAAFDDNDAQKKLSSGLVSLSGIQGPTDLAECNFVATTIPTLQQFVVTVTDATDPDLNDITPFPDVIISNIDCIPVTTTTLPGGQTTTTTTQGGGQTTTTQGGGGQTTTTVQGSGSTTTTTMFDGVSYGVTFRLTASSAGLGALQFSVNYASAPGNFIGSDDQVECTSLIQGALFAPDDNDALHKLTLGYISLDAFSAPVDVAHCNFTANSAADIPVGSDFVVTVDDASDPDGGHQTATVGVNLRQGAF
ncbi:MAG TPA: hypothetical protein VGK20_13790 [Candidatus Binatia bacterium]|jgi:hypothetical protein